MGILIDPIKEKKDIKKHILFPVTYGKTRFENFERLLELYNEKNVDAIGLYAQCEMCGIGVKKNIEDAFNNIYDAATKKCSDAILFLGRVYEYGMGYIKRDKEAACNLYKYAYKLHNIDALHSLGYLLFERGEKSVGISMIKESAEMGSKGATFHLKILRDRELIDENLSFYDIPKTLFDYDENEVNRDLTQYFIDLKNVGCVKKAIIEILENRGMGTYSEIMNDFRNKYLRGRELSSFNKRINFGKIFNEILEAKDIEMVEVKNFAVTESNLYKSKNRQNIKSKTIDFDDL